MVYAPIYILVLGGTVIIDYWAGIFIENAHGRKRQHFLLLSLVTNIGVLAFFKYYNFLNENLTQLLHGLNYRNPIPYLSILLPIGLSFHTFQAMSYTVEVYRGHVKAERNFGIYSLYIMFFPQLVAGPIERPQNMLYQFREKHEFDYAAVVEGLKKMLWGMFKKLVIADRLAIYVNTVYDSPIQYTGATYILATVFFAFQIYCDFSAYSDIAIGAARVLGFKLMTNFNRPYFSKSISEFWKRWHISLSTWFKDYLYIPLGGNKVSVPRLYFNLMIVFLISGLWHGANWTYIVWGGFNGFFLIAALVTQKTRNRLFRMLHVEKIPALHKILQIIITFVLVCISWVFFRANTIDDAFSILKKIAAADGPLFVANPSILIYSFLGILFLLLIEIKKEFYKGEFTFFNHRNLLLRNLSYVTLIVIILLFGVYDGSEFIYFQF